MKQNLLYLVARNLILLYARLMLHLDISWHAPFPAGPKLIVANHPSTTDPIYLALLCVQPITLLLIEYPFLVPLLGTYLRWSGHIPVIPGHGRSAFDAAHRLLQRGRSIALFPEGDISPQQGGFHRPHTGAARLALLTGAPVVPVGIYLPRERNRAIPFSRAGRHSMGYWYPRGPYSLTVGEALRFDGDAEDHSHVTAVSDHIMQRIISLAQEGEQRLTQAAVS